MPELPEVETVRRDLQAVLPGERIAKVEVLGTRSVRRQDPAALGSLTEGQEILDVDRRGKYLLTHLSEGSVLVAHLGMSGQLLVVPAGAEAAPHTHVIVHLDSGTEVRFVDPRTFGEIFASSAGPDGVPPELAGLGLDPLAVDRRTFARFLAGRRTMLKPLLMDQRAVAGIGNIYSDEMLFSSRLRHDRVSSSLRPAESRRLYDAMVSTLNEAIEARGSTLRDGQYRDSQGAAGEYQGRHQVYGREGLPCHRCGTTIVRGHGAGRSTYFCPRCQR